MAMRRNRKSGRFSKTTRRRSSKKTFKIGKAAETALVANAAISGLFGTNLPTFLTGKNIGGGFGSNGVDNSNEVTLPELANLVLGGSGGISGNFSDSVTGEKGLTGVIRGNIRRRGFDTMVQLVTIPIAFKVGRKLLSKSLVNPTNRMLKQVGLTDVKL